MDTFMKGLFVTLQLVSILMILSFLYASIKSLKLSFYLKREKYSRWSDLTSVEKYGFEIGNPFVWFKYFYSAQDNEDETILRYKTKIKLGFKIFIYLLITLIINAIILASLIVMSKT